ncbi:MAG: hypothetical protein HKO66_10735 [Saprospiraceae bacterium]|nr:hypothetical protein [Bacteroidia bacterium]NNL92700.1 hypothetical protein [Saprospiraceae bacterium]
MKYCPKCSKEVPTEFDICWNCSYNFISKNQERVVSDKIDFKLAKPKKLNCLRCKTTMTFEATIKLHEGPIRGVLFNLDHFFTKRESFDMYVCPNCDKVEFFTPSVNLH